MRQSVHVLFTMMESSVWDDRRTRSANNNPGYHTPTPHQKTAPPPVSETVFEHLSRNYTVVVKSLHTLVKNMYIMAVLSFQWFLQLLFFCDGMIGTHTSLHFWFFWKYDRICWVKNIHTATWIINFGDVESCVNQICFVAWPLHYKFYKWLRLTTAGNFSEPI